MAHGPRSRWGRRGLSAVCALALSLGGALSGGVVSAATVVGTHAAARTTSRPADPLAPGPYSFTTLDNDNDLTFNQLLGINDHGEIAGYFGSGAAGHPNKGYTLVPPYGQTDYTNENFPGSVQTQVTGLNDAGLTVGFWSDTNKGTGDNNFGFVDDNGTFTNVNNPLTTGTPAVNQLLGVNNNKIAVGFYVDAVGNSRGYTYDIAAKTFTAITPPTGVSNLTATGINDQGDISGFLTEAGGNVAAFLLKGGKFTVKDFPGSTSTMGLGVNNSDEVVGVYTDAAKLMHGFTWSAPNGQMAAVDDPNGQGTTTINGVDNAGDIVGFSVDGAGNTNGFLGRLRHPVAASAQFGVANQTDELSVADNGAVEVRWVQGAGKWNGPLAISGPGLAPPGASLAVSQQFGIPNETDVFVVGNDGATQVLWVQGAGKWNGPMAISPGGQLPPGAGVAASPQLGVPNQTDVFVVADTGATQVLWVQGAGKWNGPLAISPSSFAPPGAGVAASNQFGIPDQTDVFVVADTGATQVLWVQGAGKWNGPLAISPSSFAPPGAGVAASNQFGIPNQTDVFVVANDQATQVLWVQGAGKWNGPLAISPVHRAPIGIEVAVSPQFGVPNQTDVFLVANEGVLEVVWVQGSGKWKGPLDISPANLAVLPGAGVAASNQFGIPNQTDVFERASNGAPLVFWVQGADKWNGPLFI